MIVKIGPESIVVPLEAAVKVNNQLAIQYQDSGDQERRRQIIGALYQLNLPIFKQWKVYDFDAKEDYEQECFFWLARALEKWDRTRIKSDFPYFLKRYYVAKAADQQMREHPKESVSDVEIAVKDDELDSLFWQEAEKLLGPEPWEIMRAIVFEGLNPPDVARRIGKPLRTISRHYRDACETMRVHIAARSLKPAKVEEKFGDGEWLGFKKFCRVMDLTPEYLKNWLNPNRPATVCPTYIDPRDILDVQGTKIRYLFTARDGLVYPRRVRKKPDGQAA